jgi:transcription elongation GreA/GreB family factor
MLGWMARNPRLPKVDTVVAGDHHMTGRSSEKARLGSRVKVSGFIPGADTVLQLVREEEADYRELKVPTNGPLAEALLGTKAGDRVVVQILGAASPLTVLEIDNRPR